MNLNSPPVPPGAPQDATDGRVVSKAGGQGWDHREAFWRQWDRVLHIRTFPTPNQDLTGAVEGLGLLALMVADQKFLKEWEERPLHKGPGNTLFATLQDNQRALEIVASLVSRKAWAEKQRKVSHLAPWKVSGGESLNGTNGSEPVSSGPLIVASTNGHDG